MISKLMPKALLQFMLITSCLFILNSCKTAPAYIVPEIGPIPAHFKEAPKGWLIAQPQDHIDRGKWWLIFHDAQLNALEEKVTLSNQNILQAAAQYRQACALVQEARASYFPTIGMSAALNRQNQSAFVADTHTSNASLSATPVTNRSLTLNAIWEPDLWNSISNSVESSKDNAQAAQAKLGLMRLSEQASLAQFYFELKALDRDQKLLDNTVINYRKALKITQNLYQSGVDAETDIIQARAQLESAQSLALNNGINRAQYEHAIAVLTGQPPENFFLAPIILALKPPVIPLYIPSRLLQRRPDIAAAERLAAQANAQIGLAVSAYFPDLTFSTSGTRAGMGLTPLFSLPALSWTAGSALAATLFDGGLRTSATMAARANYEAAAANYRQTVLTAFQDVEDNLAALRILEPQLILLNKAVADARLAVKLVIHQYTAGTVSYSTVITAQINAFNAEKAAIDTAGLRMTATVGLIKALGGGWESVQDKNFMAI